MSQYRDRRGQRIGRYTVAEDWGRTRSGKVLWRLVEDETGHEKFLRTEQVIRLDRAELSRS